MRGTISRRRILATAALPLALALAFGGIAEAKKAKTFSEQKAVHAAIPDAPAAGQPATLLTSEIKVPKKYKKKLVGDLDVTGFQTTGSAPQSGFDLDVWLTAPNGQIGLIVFGLNSQNIGPLTMNDDTSVSTCSPPPCTDPFQSLNPPFAGTANVSRNFLGVFPVSPLSAFDGTKMRGTWRLSVYDIIGAPVRTSILNSWGLRIKPAKPVEE